MKRINVLIIGIFLVAFSGLFLGCVTDMASLKIKKTLPQSKLAYYNDSFDKLRTDLWEKAGYISEAQKDNFKLADMNIEDGKLRIQTQTGCFSKGGLASKYALRGNFDVQVDCQIDFLQGVHGMDHSLMFLVSEKSTALRGKGTVFIGLFRKEGRDFSAIFSAYTKKGILHRGKLHKIGNFDGSLRIVRVGNKITTLYKKKGDTEWERMNTFPYTTGDVFLGFKLQNFTSKRTSIAAESSITATFDNFRINAAAGIIEEEI